MRQSEKDKAKLCPLPKGRGLLFYSVKDKTWVIENSQVLHINKLF